MAPRTNDPMDIELDEPISLAKTSSIKRKRDEDDSYEIQLREEMLIEDFREQLNARKKDELVEELLWFYEHSVMVEEDSSWDPEKNSFELEVN